MFSAGDEKKGGQNSPAPLPSQKEQKTVDQQLHEKFDFLVKQGMIDADPESKSELALTESQFLKKPNSIYPILLCWIKTKTFQNESLTPKQKIDKIIMPLLELVWEMATIDMGCRYFLNRFLTDLLLAALQANENEIALFIMKRKNVLIKPNFLYEMLREISDDQMDLVERFLKLCEENNINPLPIFMQKHYDLPVLQLLGISEKKGAITSMVINFAFEQVNRAMKDFRLIRVIPGTEGKARRFRSFWKDYPLPFWFAAEFTYVGQLGKVWSHCAGQVPPDFFQTLYALYRPIESVEYEKKKNPESYQTLIDSFWSSHEKTLSTAMESKRFEFVFEDEKSPAFDIVSITYALNGLMHFTLSCLRMQNPDITQFIMEKLGQQPYAKELKKLFANGIKKEIFDLRDNDDFATLETHFSSCLSALGENNSIKLMDLLLHVAKAGQCNYFIFLINKYPEKIKEEFSVKIFFEIVWIWTCGNLSRNCIVKLLKLNADRMIPSQSRHLLESCKHDYSMTKILIEAKADPNQVYGYGNVTLLQKVVTERYFDVATLLIEHKASVTTPAPQERSTYFIHSEQPSLFKKINAMGGFAFKDRVDLRTQETVFTNLIKGILRHLSDLLNLPYDYWYHPFDDFGYFKLDCPNHQLLFQKCCEQVNEDAQIYIQFYLQKEYFLLYQHLSDLLVKLQTSQKLAFDDPSLKDEFLTAYEMPENHIHEFFLDSKIVGYINLSGKRFAIDIGVLVREQKACLEMAVNFFKEFPTTFPTDLVNIICEYFCCADLKSSFAEFKNMPLTAQHDFLKKEEVEWNKDTICRAATESLLRFRIPESMLHSFNVAEKGKDLASEIRDELIRLFTEEKEYQTLNRVKYVYFVIPTSNAAHSTPCLINLSAKTISIFDPYLDRGQKEALDKFQRMLTTTYQKGQVEEKHPLADFKILEPSKLCQPMQPKEDLRNCGIFSAMFIMGTILELEQCQAGRRYFINMLTGLGLKQTKNQLYLHEALGGLLTALGCGKSLRPSTMRELALQAPVVCTRQTPK